MKGEIILLYEAIDIIKRILINYADEPTVRELGESFIKLCKINGYGNTNK